MTFTFTALAKLPLPTAVTQGAAVSSPGLLLSASSRFFFEPHMMFYFSPFEFSPFSRGRLIPARVTLSNSDSSFVHTRWKEGAPGP